MESPSLGSWVAMGVVVEAGVVMIEGGGEEVAVVSNTDGEGLEQTSVSPSGRQVSADVVDVIGTSKWQTSHAFTNYHTR